MLSAGCLDQSGSSIMPIPEREKPRKIYSILTEADSKTDNLILPPFLSERKRK